MGIDNNTVPHYSMETLSFNLKNCKNFKGIPKNYTKNYKGIIASHTVICIPRTEPKKLLGRGTNKLIHTVPNFQKRLQNNTPKMDKESNFEKKESLLVL